MNDWQAAVREAIDLIGRVAGYEGVALRLTALRDRGKIRFAADMEDRGRASLTGIITLGTEAFAGSLLGLAETLAHEEFHCQQNPFLKTASFWAGVATRTPTMRRYERPAYLAALRFLESAESSLPKWAEEAKRERREVRAAFARHYGATLSGNSACQEDYL